MLDLQFYREVHVATDCKVYNPSCILCIRYMAAKCYIAHMLQAIRSSKQPSRCFEISKKGGPGTGSRPIW